MEHVINILVWGCLWHLRFFVRRWREFSELERGLDLKTIPFFFIPFYLLSNMKIVYILS